MGSVNDLVRNQFGDLTVLSRDGSTKNGRATWLCQCVCGKTKIVSGNSLLSNLVKSCGCARNRAQRKNLIGVKFGRLLVIKFVSFGRHRANWDCLCDCGNKYVVSSTDLIRGKTKSCGCIKREKTGNKNHNYNPNLTDEERILQRKYKGYTDWRSAVFAKDKYTCQTCGSVGGKIQAHHINNYSTYKELRITLGNGVTLCVRCHKEFHSLFGIKRTDSEDYYTFLSLKGKNITVREQLNTEISLISNVKLREFVFFVLGKLPNSFFEKPASSSGKYHPPQSNMYSGLLNHSRMVVYLAKKLCEPFNLQQKDVDIVIAAAVLHDGLKYGLIEQKHTTQTHAIDMAKFIKILGKSFPEISDEISVLSDAVLFHMGRWSIEHKEMPRKKFPEEYSTVERIVHLADVVSTMPNISFTFINDEIFLA